MSGEAEAGEWGWRTEWGFRGEEARAGKAREGRAARGIWAVSVGQGDWALCSFRPRGPRAWTQPAACPCMRRWVGQQDGTGLGAEKTGLAQAEVHQAGDKVGLEKLRPSLSWPLSLSSLLRRTLGNSQTSDCVGRWTPVSWQPRGAVRHGDRQGGRDPGHLEAEVGFVCGLRAAENGQGMVPTAGWAPGVVWVPLLGLVPLLTGPYQVAATVTAGGSTGDQQSGRNPFCTGEVGHLQG